MRGLVIALAALAVCLGCVDPEKRDPAETAAEALSAEADRQFEDAFRTILMGGADKAAAKFEALRSRKDLGGRRAADCVFWMGFCAESRGREAEARAHYREVAEKFAKSRYAEMAKERLERLDASLAGVEAAGQ
ncbi:MAG TPA: hypothetical protein P5137_12400 [Candidatus Brocadiia bacterium]|nr:hypothetical protein [Candidatus Brocadiia bacterium]